MIDRERLIKLMMMTTSSNDGEALAAVRKANSLLAANQSNWHDFIKAVPAPRPRPKPMGRGMFEEQFKPNYTDPEIPRMLNALLRDVKGGGFRDFLLSLKDHWEEKGSLTQGQYNALLASFERAK
jgi:hypothetical protein